MTHTYTDCRSETGITVGLIDGIIAIARVLSKRDHSSPEVIQALKDLRTDEDVALAIGAAPFYETYLAAVKQSSLTYSTHPEAWTMLPAAVKRHLLKLAESQLHNPGFPLEGEAAPTTVGEAEPAGPASKSTKRCTCSFLAQTLGDGCEKCHPECFEDEGPKDPNLLGCWGNSSCPCDSKCPEDCPLYFPDESEPAPTGGEGSREGEEQEGPKRDWHRWNKLAQGIAHTYPRHTDSVKVKDAAGHEAFASWADGHWAFRLGEKSLEVVEWRELASK